MVINNIKCKKGVLNEKKWVKAYKIVPPKKAKILQPCRKNEKNRDKKIPTHVERNMLFWGKDFGKVNFGHFFCPFLKT